MNQLYDFIGETGFVDAGLIGQIVIKIFKHLAELGGVNISCDNGIDVRVGEKDFKFIPVKIAVGIGDGCRIFEIRRVGFQYVVFGATSFNSE